MTAIRTPSIELLLDNELSTKVKGVVDKFCLSDNQVHDVMDILLTEMKQGMSAQAEQRTQSSLQMEVTYVRSLLDGTENGDFIALDLGGTNFRVLLVRFKNGKCTSKSRNYNLTRDILHGPASGVFDHLAESIYLFAKEEDILHERLPIGFTFSFPMKQESIKKGILVTWTKSFNCTDGVGKDAVKFLEDAINRRGDVKADVVAILNDTTGTLLAGSYLDKRCEIGLIMGTGCNAAYVEKLENVDKWDGEKTEPKQVVIDIEWGAFGDNGSLDFMKTSYDFEVDIHSNYRGSFTFEKLFSGHYLGDVVRLVILNLAEDKLLFKGHTSHRLYHWGAVKASHVSGVEKDTAEKHPNTTKLLTDLNLKDHGTDSDISIIRYLCSAVSIRAAQLVSACLAVLMNHMKKQESVVAIDGSLYKHHPKMHNMMMAWLEELAPDTKSKLVLANDGSGRGAAFLAAVVDQH